MNFYFCVQYTFNDCLKSLNREFYGILPNLTKTKDQ